MMSRYPEKILDHETRLHVQSYDETGFNAVSLLALVALLAMMLIPLIEAVGRRFAGIGVPGAANWVQHLTLWLGLLGGILATMKRGHLSISAMKMFRTGKITDYFAIATGAGATGVLLCLALASFDLVKFQYESPEMLGGWLPLWVAQAAMPVCFLVIAWYTIRTSANKWQYQALVLLLAGLVTGLILATPLAISQPLTVFGFFLIIPLAILGMPLYAVLGGASILLFIAADVPVAAVPAETYRILTQPVLPSIPLFTLCGTVLAAGGAPKRLLRFVSAWTGWLPGGAAISTVVGCAFFTAITGASGVTILALGSLLLPILIGAHLGKSFSTGLLTASGSVGLLFPPSLPVILYGVYGHVAIDRLFLAALVPGLLLVAMLSGFSLYRGRKHIKQRPIFDLREAWKATWAAKGDLLLPVLILVGLFGGFMTLVETAALTALWAILLETVFHKQLDFHCKLPKAIIESTVLVGALLMVLGIAAGLISYFVDAQIPQIATEWVMTVISSKLVFLLALNGMLLVVGTLMDIFSAIIVVVPLIVPMGLAFGVDPVHLGIIFLANLELGYLTPPVGMNLFLSSLRFELPLLEIWRTVVPFLIIFVVWVLLITYLPALTIW